MSLSTPEDPDPLLEFSSEPAEVKAGKQPVEPAVQPVAAPVVAKPDPPAVPPATRLDVRVELLERALKESRSQALALKSDVATLVRVVADIRKQAEGRAVPPGPSAPGPKTPLAAAVAGLILGVSLGVFGWQYLSGEAEATLTPATPVAAQALVAEPQDGAPPASVSQASEASQAPEAPAPNAPGTPEAANDSEASQARQAITGREAPKAPRLLQAPPAPQSRPASQATQASRYVGTLSIDADPGGEVFVNRQSAGTTPLRLTNLRAGSHLIWIERDGYRRWTRVVQVPADRVTRVSADLEPIAAR